MDIILRGYIVIQTIYTVNVQGIFSLRRTCSHIHAPVSITCGPGEMIYVHQTTLSAWEGALSSSCDIALCNDICHVYTNNWDRRFNGKRQADHTFVREFLLSYPVHYGRCNSSSMSNTVHIVYECVQESSLHSICETRETSDSGVGFLTSPEFPDPEVREASSCECQLTATEKGVVHLTGIFVNPVVPLDGSNGWTLEMVNNIGTHVKIHKSPVMAKTIDAFSPSSLKLTFTSSGDTSKQDTFFTGYPAGFWIRYNVHPNYAKVILKCSGKPLAEGISAETIGIICGLSITFILFMLTVTFFIRKMWIKHTGKIRKQREQPRRIKIAHINLGIEPDADDLDEETLRQNIQRRCNSIPEIYFDQKFSHLQLFEETNPSRKSNGRKGSTISTSSGCGVSLATLQSQDISVFLDDDSDEELKQCMFVPLELSIMDLEGVTDDSIDV